jgi:hypothetical protein
MDYKHLISLFAYDNDWEHAYILKMNRERITHLSKMTNPLPNKERKHSLRSWPMTIEGINSGREKNAIENIMKWKEIIREELRS